MSTQWLLNMHLFIEWLYLIKHLPGQRYLESTRPGLARNQMGVSNLD